MADSLGVSKAAIDQVGSGYRPLPPGWCVFIEKSSSAAIVAEDLRPDVNWVRFPDAEWPHPAGHPAVCVDMAQRPKGQSLEGRLLAA